MRDYGAFDLAAFQEMVADVFYPLNNQFLTGHNDACITNYWANWDLCNMASIRTTSASRPCATTSSPPRAAEAITAPPAAATTSSASVP